MKARTDARDQARELRSRGLPLRAIAVRVDASLSSVSVWVRDVVPLPGDASASQPASSVEASSRRCSRCGVEQPTDQFSRDKHGWQSWCKACWRAYAAANRDAMRAASDARRARAREYVADVKRRHACVDCGLREPACLEFDHVGPKSSSINRLVACRAGVERLRAEIERCDIVCVNCHRRRTVVRRGNPGPRPFDRARQRNTAVAREWATLLGCTDCGETDPDVLDYDHIGEKRANIGTLTSNGVRLALLFEEMLRCEVRCANCHRRRHDRLRRAAAP